MPFLWVDEQELHVMFESRIQETQNTIVEEIVQVDTASRQGLERTLKHEIRQLEIPTKLNRIDTRFHSRVQDMEQTLLKEIQQVKNLVETKADQEKLDQVHIDLSNKAQDNTKAVIEEVKKADTHLEIMRTHQETLQRIYQVEQSLSKELQQLQVLSEVSQLLDKVSTLQDEMSRLSNRVTTLLPALSSDEEKPVHDLIKDQIEIARQALTTLEQKQTDWLNEHFSRIQNAQQGEQQARQAQQKRLSTLASHFFPTMGEAS